MANNLDELKRQIKADMLIRQAQIITIKAIELRWGLRPALLLPEEAELLEALNRRPDLRARLLERHTLETQKRPL